jgi:hypothetical protein
MDPQWHVDPHYLLKTGSVHILSVLGVVGWYDAVSWQHDTMSEDYFVDVKVVASGGYLHLLQAPFGAAAAI